MITECYTCQYSSRDLHEEPCGSCVDYNDWTPRMEKQLEPQVKVNMTDCIREICQEIENLLVEKNESYGNSAADPIKIFSKTDVLEQINVRIDDKLSRIMRGNEYGQEDTELDLIGYLILKRAVKKYMLEEL